MSWDENPLTLEELREAYLNFYVDYKSERAHHEERWDAFLAEFKRAAAEQAWDAGNSAAGVMLMSNPPQRVQNPHRVKTVIPDPVPVKDSIVVKQDIGGPYPVYKYIKLDLHPDGAVTWDDSYKHEVQRF